MDAQTVPLPPEAESFLDGASEAGDIDGCTYLVCRLYGDRAALASIVGPPPRINEAALVAHLAGDRSAGPVVERGRSRYEICCDLTALADAVLSELPEQWRGSLITEGFLNLPYHVEQLAEVLAAWAITDITEGGAMLPFLPRVRLKSVRGGDDEPFKRDGMRLRSPSWIRRRVRTYDSSWRLREMAARALRRILTVQGRFLRPDQGRVEEMLNAQIEACRGMIIAREAKKTLAAAPSRRDRRSIKRALRLARGVIGDDRLRAFVRGAPVRLDGPNAALEVRRARSVMSVGHGALAVSLLAPSGEHLAELCTYVKRTPAIDQVCAFSMFMTAGLEQEVLDTANVIRLTEAGGSHPILESHRSRRGAVDQIDEPVRRRPPQRSSWEQQRDRCDRYWGETRQIWTEALGVFAMGAKPWAVAKTP